MARKARTEVTIGVTMELTIALPETPGLATDVAVIVTTPEPVVVTVGMPAVTTKVAGPATDHVTACDRVEGLTNAVAVKLSPGATVVAEGVTTILVISASTPSDTTKSANLLGSATEVARTVVVPVVGVAAKVRVPEVVGELNVPGTSAPGPAPTIDQVTAAL